MFKKIQYIYLLKKYIKWGVWRVAVCPSYIQDARSLKVKIPTKKYRPLHYTPITVSSLSWQHRVPSVSLNLPLTSRQAKQNRPIRYRLPCHQVDFLLQCVFVFLVNNTEDKNPQTLFQSPELEQGLKTQQVYQYKLTDVFSLPSIHSY